MFDLLDMMIAIFPFILLLIAIGITPSKEKIINGQLKTFKPEIHIGVYILAFFPLLLSVYFLMPLFSESSGNIFYYLTNAIFMISISLGIIGLNYRNYNLFTEKAGSSIYPQSISHDPGYGSGYEQQYEPRVALPIPMSNQQEHGHEPINVEPIPPIHSKTKTKAGQAQYTYQYVECPQCGAAIKVNISVRPIKISCPQCGVEGMVQ